MEKYIENDSEPYGETRKIPITFFIPKINENRFFYENGLAKFIDKLVVKVYSNLEICHQLWEQFSPNQSLFQLWEFRYSWYLGYRYQPFFYTIQLNNQPLAVLPLCFNEDKKEFQWFGGWWPEDNLFFVKDEKFIPLLFKIAPKPLLLTGILPFDNLKNYQLLEDEYKYISDISRIKTFDDYLSNLSKKNRYHFKNYHYRFSLLEPKIVFLEGNRSSMLKILKKLSIIDYERKDVSEYRKSERMNTFREIYLHQGRYKIFTLYGKIKNYDFALDILGVYKNQFYILTGAADIERFPGAIHYLTYLEIEKAIQMGYSLVDAMQIDYNWKHKYFTPKPMLKFEKK
jgi:hypothetical protein